MRLNDCNRPGFDGGAIANFVLDYCEERRLEVSHLSLQKILYFCHAWFLVELGRPLIKQHFEAWQHGPVLQHLYHQFKAAGDAPINTRATRLNSADGRRTIVQYELDTETEALLRRLVEVYSRQQPGHLVALSHRSGGPWDRVWRHSGPVNPGMRIDNESIRQYYAEIKGNTRRRTRMVQWLK